MSPTAAATKTTGNDAGRETIHYSRCQMVPTASSLAFQLGYLKQPASSGGAQIAVSLGDFDHEDDRLWMRHAGTTKSIWKRSLGADTRVIALSWHDNSQPVYALPDGPVKSPADLKGRRIALFHTQQKFDVDRMVFVKPYVAALAREGLRLADVRIVETPLERELVKDAAPTAKNFFLTVAELFVRQLIRGEVDAIATPLPAEVVRFFDLRKVYDTEDDPDIAVRTELRMLAVSGTTLREHREQLVQLLARLIAAGTWAASNADEARRHLAADLTVDEAVLRVRGIDPVRLTALDLSPAQIDALRKKKDFLIEIGAVAQDFPIDDWIDTSILRDARALAARQETQRASTVSA